MVSSLLVDLLSVTYRPDLDMLVGRWGYQPAPDLLPAAYEQLTGQAMACGCRFWLQDIRRRTLNDPHITKWLLATYFPQMATRLSGRLMVAYLTSPALLEIILNDPSYVPPNAYDKQNFVVAFFSNEGEATAWLQH